MVGQKERNLLERKGRGELDSLNQSFYETCVHTCDANAMLGVASPDEARQPSVEMHNTSSIRPVVAGCLCASAPRVRVSVTVSVRAGNLWMDST